MGVTPTSIILKDLGKTYDGHQWVLQGINLTIEDGEFFTVVGPSGCGKSTLLNMIAGLIPVSHGQIIINGKDVTDLPPKDHQLTMVFQSYALFPFLDVAHNISFGLSTSQLGKEEIKQRVDEAMEMTGLTSLAKRRPRELSGGQRQRVAIARAVASNAKICLMDEPLSNLDARLREKMRSRLRELQRRLHMTIIYVTHDQIEAMTMADRIMVLNNHEIQQIGTPQSIYEHPQNTFVASFFGNPPMNLLTADAQGSSLAISDHFSVQTKSALPAGHYKVGIRPQNIEVSTAQPTNAHISNIEYQGTNQILDLDLADHQHLQVQIATKSQQLAVGQAVHLHAEQQFYVFDDQDKLFSEEGIQ